MKELIRQGDLERVLTQDQLKVSAVDNIMCRSKLNDSYVSETTRRWQCI